LQKQKELYRANQVAIQIKTGEAWIKFATGKKTEALSLMKTAADMEDSTSKHPVTPGEVLPARELYADMFLQMKQNDKALQTYEAVLQKSPNRFNSLYGAGDAAERSGNIEKAVFYYKQLFAIADSNSNRPELSAARSFLNKHQ
jgi:tetratricopeptide (TPR) repeat protein